MKVVNIFKQYKVNELSGIQGKVLIKQDKYLNRRVIVLEGNVTTAAVLTIPCNLHKNYVNKINITRFIFKPMWKASTYL